MSSLREITSHDRTSFALTLLAVLMILILVWMK